jgi:hypothetical protein
LSPFPPSPLAAPIPPFPHVKPNYLPLTHPTGCLTCRKRKVKCDEAKPVCSRCTRLQRQCVWSDELQMIPHRRVPPYSHTSPAIVSASFPGSTDALELSLLSGQSFVVEFPNVDRATVPYMHHFVTFCCRFLAYSNDSEGNPFQEALVPLAVTSPALLHSMAAVSAGHLARSQRHHQLIAQNHYATALRELNASLSDPVVARSDSTLGACLMLCVYEVRFLTLILLAWWLICSRYHIRRTHFGLSIFKELET